ncbi:MAG: mechanosensitive ion channel family protein [Armatimonadetes bacterium]|nr:mechanosensitive ion channel family protein [Armatimonadota bacterium]
MPNLPSIPSPPATAPSGTSSPHIHWDDLFSPEAWRRFGDTLWHIALLLLIYVLLRGVLRRLIDRGLEPVLARSGEKMDHGQAARLKTLAGLVNSIVSYVLTFVFGVMLLRTFDLDPIPLLTTASVAGLAVGFGAQKLVKDVISGFFILLENQYAVGDYVTIGPATGTVEEVGMRTTRIRDDVGKLYILSNGDITQVVNQSRGAVETFLEIGVAAATEVDKATEIINAAGKELAEQRPDLGFAEPPQVQGLGGMDGTKLTLRVTCPVTAPARLAEAQVALRSLIHQRLVEAGIGLA